MAVTLDNFLEDQAFHTPSIIKMYAVVEDARRTLGFVNPSNNTDIMQQASWVTKQYRKFISTIKDEVLYKAKHSDPRELVDTLRTQMDELDSYPQNEQTALYYTVRDAWLEQTINLVNYWIATGGHVEDFGYAVESEGDMNV